MHSLPIFCRSLRRVPQSVYFVWLNHLTILDDGSGAIWYFNQSTEILILGFIPFLLKTLIILHSKKIYGFGTDRMHLWRMTMDCYTLEYDQVKLSWFKIIEWCQVSVDPAEIWWHGLVLKEFILQRPPSDSKGILRSLHERLTSDVSQLSLGIFHELLVEWVFFSNVQVQNLKASTCTSEEETHPTRSSWRMPRDNCDS